MFRQSIAHKPVRYFLIRELHMHNLASQTAAKFLRNLRSVSAYIDSSKAVYLIHSQQFRAQDPIIGIVRFLISKRAECNGSNIYRANKRDLSIATGCIDFPLVSDRETMAPLCKVFYMPAALAREDVLPQHNINAPMNQVGRRTQYSTPRSSKCCHTFPT